MAHASLDSALGPCQQGMDDLACAIGTARCQAVGIMDPVQCCLPMPHSIIVQADFNCPGGCFPGGATVLIKDGRRKTMAQLRIGDHVQVLGRGGRLSFEPVYLFGHQDAAARSSMLSLTVLSSSTNHTTQLTLTADHFLPVQQPQPHAPGHKLGMTVSVMKRAADVAVGDKVWAVDAGGEVSVQTVVATSVRLVQGLFNPFTPAGTIVVDGVVASVHSRWFLDGLMDRLGATHLIPQLYQAILLPAYYAVYCTLGPDWVRWLDDIFDFASAGTDTPIASMVLLWTCVGVALAPVFALASKLPEANGRNST